MKFILDVLNWKRSLLLSVTTLGILIILNFYGLYTNKFYFLKFDNYIFPLLTIVHFVFLYVFWFKIKEQEYTDTPMRNLEYSLYVIFLVYIFKTLDTFFILLSYSNYDDYIIPGTFMPIGILMFTLYLFLLLITLVTFRHRKELIGNYNFESMNQNIDSWE